MSTIREIISLTDEGKFLGEMRLFDEALVGRAGTEELTRCGHVAMTEQLPCLAEATRLSKESAHRELLRLLDEKKGSAMIHGNYV